MLLSLVASLLEAGRGLLQASEEDGAMVVLEEQNSKTMMHYKTAVVATDVYR